MKALILTVLCLCIFIFGNGQIDSIGSGHAMQFHDAGDYIDLGNIYDDLTLPLTISAWVYLDPSANTISPILATQENADLYNGIQMFIGPNQFIFEYGDGRGTGSPAFRKGKIANFTTLDLLGRWLHVCGVMNTATDIQLYINGIDIGGDLSGFTTFPMASNFPTDVTKIGHYLSNGVTFSFQGSIDEVRLWKRGLSAEEVRAGMSKKLNGNESGLIGYWTFDEKTGDTLFDKSTNGFNGHVIGSPTRKYSGAPIGNKSAFAYPPPQKYSLVDGVREIDVLGITGNPQGVQIYEVTQPPSQSQGLDPALGNKPYFGVFLASLNTPNAFDAVLTVGGEASCSTSQRADNSIPDWTPSPVPITNIPGRQEFVIIKPTFPLDLGPDLSLCDQSSTAINSNLDVSQHPILWNTGASTTSITVDHSGVYIARSVDCPLIADTVAIFFLSHPEPAKLGDDISKCIFEPLLLRPTVDTTNYEFTWQDGSKAPVYHADGFGTYWVTVKNACGEVSDTIKITGVSYDLTEIPNVFTPNGDDKNEFFVIRDDLKGQVTLDVFNRWGKAVLRSDNYNNDWDGGELGAGVYFIRLTGPCIDYKTWITIIR